MEILKERIRKDGKNLGGGILKVDSFINHQVDPTADGRLRRRIRPPLRRTGRHPRADGRDLRHRPGPGHCHAHELPVVYARKSKPITMPDQVYLTVAPSHTKGRMVELIVSPEFLAKGERVLIIDDFLASGATILGLARLARAAGAEVVGIGALIEKSFEGGREALQPLGLPVESLVCIHSMEDGQILFCD